MNHLWQYYSISQTIASTFGSRSTLFHYERLDVIPNLLCSFQTKKTSLRIGRYVVWVKQLLWPALLTNFCFKYERLETRLLTHLFFCLFLKILIFRFWVFFVATMHYPCHCQTATMTLQGKWLKLLCGFLENFPQLSRLQDFISRFTSCLGGFAAAFWTFNDPPITSSFANVWNSRWQKIHHVMKSPCFWYNWHIIFLPFWKFDYETSTPPVIIGLSARWWSRLQTVMRPSCCSTRETLFEHNS